MKIPKKKVEGHAPFNGRNPVIYDSFWAKIVLFPLKGQVLTEILEI